MQHFMVGPQGGGPTMTSLWAWHDAADTATITTEAGGRVIHWADKSGSGNHAFRDSGHTDRPHSGSRMHNGRNVIDFQGSHSLMLTGLPGGGASSGLIVYRTDSTGNAHRIVTGRVGGSGTATYALVFSQGGSNAVAFNHHSSVIWTGVLGDPPDTEPHIGGWVRAGATGRFLFDGTLGESGDATDLAFVGSLCYGARHNGSVLVERLDGFIAEVLLYEKALDSAELAHNLAYLQDKWGL